MNLITFMTDFGTKDSYVGCVKGVILSINPNAQIVDITHQIPQFRIKEAAVNLVNYAYFYPKGTTHLVVIDPGVGSERIPVVLKTAQHCYVGPDNGVFSFIFDKEAFNLYQILPEKIQAIWLQDTARSTTFHARDIFGPAAAFLSKGVSVEKFARPLHKLPVRLLLNNIPSGKDLRVAVLVVDHFGNIVLNFSRQDHMAMGGKSIREIRIADRTLSRIKQTYSDAREGELMALWGSSGFLEIAVNQGSAAQKLGIAPGEMDALIIFSG